MLGFQSISQVSTTYGHGLAQAMVENRGNSLVLRCSASENGGTARFASRLIGEREILRYSQSVSRSRGEGFFGSARDTHGQSEQHATEVAVPMPSSRLARFLWAVCIRRRQEAVWNKDVVAGCARCYTPSGPARPLDLKEIKALCKSAGHRAVGQLPTWLIEQVESATDLDER